MAATELIPHLFRSEFSKITAVLCKFLGIEHLATAEDIAGDTFLAAMETWPYKGIPENPVAWLYHVAKNKAMTRLNRDHVFAARVAPRLRTDPTAWEQEEIDLSPGNISDSQLRMLFAICHPAIPPEAQIGLALRILCGFGIGEIADAFLTNKEVINKRLYRAREKLRLEKVEIALPAVAEVDYRLATVLRTLYLLFSEGYYSESQDVVLREDLCLEAMRLAHLLTENAGTNKPAVNALLSLMCFHASRFPARRDGNGELVMYDDQDETLWNRELIAKGVHYMRLASVGDHLSKYHLEAGIAYWHTVKTDTKEKWEHILQLYNRLLQVEYSPVAALNRTYALSKANGVGEAIAEAEKLRLTGNHYYFVLLGELYTGVDHEKAKAHFEAAYDLAKTQTDKRSIRRKLDKLP
jgi:predicted RNA polymerase sigma factor